MAKKNVPIEVKFKNTASAKQRLIFLFIQTADAYNRYSDIRFQKLGLSLIRMVVLSALEMNGGTMKPSEIAKWTFRSPHNITTLIRRLERDGLVTISPNRTDNRSVDVVLTEKGRQYIKKAKPIYLDVRKKALDSITDKQIQVLERIIAVMKSNIEHSMGID